MRALVLFLGLACQGLCLAACSPSNELLVDLRTNFVPEVEFIRATVTIAGGTPIETLAGAGQDFVSGERIAEVAGLETGDVRFTVHLWNDAGAPIAERAVIATIDGRTGVTIVISRECAGVVCPSMGEEALVCLGGRCVSPRCYEELPELCGPRDCNAAEDCSAPAACAERSCTESGACLPIPVAGACALDEYCAADVGCITRDTPPMPMDCAARHDWSTAYGGMGTSGRHEAHHLTLDASGALYVAGTLGGPAMYGGALLTGGAFLASYDADGSHRWSVGFGDRTTVISDIATDGSRVYAVGRTDAAFDIDGMPVGYVGGQDGFVAAFTAGDGSHTWSQAIGTVEEDSVDAVAVGPSGDIYILGEFSTTLALGVDVLMSNGFDDVYLARLDATNGDKRWGRGFGAAFTDDAQSIAVDDDENIYVSAQLLGPTDLGGRSVEGTILARFDSTGADQWAESFGPANFVSLTELGVGSDGAVYAGGSYQRFPFEYFGTNHDATDGTTDLVWMSVGADGTERWAQTVGTTENESVLGMGTVDSSAVITGFVNAPLDLGGGTVGAADGGGTDMFVASYDLAGNHEWSCVYDSTSRAAGESVRVLGDAVFIVGRTALGTTDVGGGPLGDADDTHSLVFSFGR